MNNSTTFPPRWVIDITTPKMDKNLEGNQMRTSQSPLGMICFPVQDLLSNDEYEGGCILGNLLEATLF